MRTGVAPESISDLGLNLFLAGGMWRKPSKVEHYSPNGPFQTTT